MFEFRPGPVFANVLLVDEINRASPKTQSALLEAMQEIQVTIDGATYGLDRPFMVIATQNPIEYEGTYPLPEAQLDRFTMRLSLGYPPLAEEARMLAEQTTEPPLDSLEPVASAADLLAAIDAGAGDLRRGEPQPLRRRACFGRRARPPGSHWGPARGRASPFCASRRRVRSRTGATTCSRTTSRQSRCRCSRTVLILSPEARSAGLTPGEIVQEAVEQTPVPV